MTAPQARKFTAGQLMTVLAGDADRTFCSWGELLDVLGWLLQDCPMAEEVGAAIEECRPYVEDLYPELAGYDPPAGDASDTDVLSWLADIEGRHAPLFELEPIAESG